MATSPDVRHRLVQALPKTELHLHLEGSLEPAMMLDMAQRNGRAHLLPFTTLEQAKAAFKFKDLQEFLDLYTEGSAAALRTEQDFYELTAAYLQQAKANNIVHCELFFDPQSHTEQGIALGTVVTGITRALKEGQAQLGITSLLIMCVLRHLGPEAALAAVQQALPFKEHIAGLGLDSTELGWPPHLFKPAFDCARAAGLHCVAHAGEEGPPEFVAEAVDALGAERIDHGVHCLDDPALVQRLVQQRLPLTVCPLSNVQLKVYDGELQQRVAQLLSSGLLCTINSDDPSYFAGYLNDNYDFLIQSQDVTAEQIRDLVCNGFEASFLSQQQKQAHIQQVHQTYQQVMAA